MSGHAHDEVIMEFSVPDIIVILLSTGLLLVLVVYFLKQLKRLCKVYLDRQIQRAVQLAALERQQREAAKEVMVNL